MWDRPGLGTLLLWLLVLGLSERLGSHDAVAQVRQDFKTLDLVIDEELFEEICPVLLVSEEQLPHLRALHASYLRSVREVDRLADQSMHRAGLDQITLLSRDREQRLRRPLRATEIEAHEEAERRFYEEVAGLMPPVVREKVLATREADDLLAVFWRELESTLRPEQTHLLQSAKVLAYRDNYYGNFASDTYFGDLAEPLDLRQVLEQAIGDVPELAFLEGYSRDCSQDIGEESVAELVTRRIRQIVLRYEADLFRRLQADYAHRRRLPNDTDSQFHSSSDRDGRRKLKSVARRWRGEYQGLTTATSLIAVELGRVDQAARSVWEKHVQRSLCPELTADRWPDRMVRWLECRSDGTEDQVAAADTLYTSYRDERHVLIGAAIRAGARALGRHGVMEGEEPAQQRALHARVRVETLTERTLSRFSELLGPVQREAFREEMQRFQATHGSIAAPLELIGPMTNSENGRE